MPHSHPTRRALLAATAIAAGAALTLTRTAHAEPSPKRESNVSKTPLKILVLGGTVFLGPAVVDYALERGHTVTLFNRGKTNAHLYPNLEKLRGDRNDDLRSLEGRSWDAVIDTSGQHPKQVTSVCELLKEDVKHYVFVSSISVYEAFGSKAETIDETASTFPMPEPMPDRMTGATYGAMKAGCERAAEAVLPGRVSNVRPGLIVGPLDKTDRFTSWPVRVDGGGDLIAPGDGSSQIQFIDVRDLGAWLVRLCETNASGVFNAVGYEGEHTLADLVHGCRCATTTPSTVHWIPEAFLIANKSSPWRDFVHLPPEGQTILSNARAKEAGLTFRPLADTIRDTLAWAKTERGAQPMKWGIGAEREAAILEAWDQRDDAAPKTDPK